MSTSYLLTIELINILKFIDLNYPSNIIQKVFNNFKEIPTLSFF